MHAVAGCDAHNVLRVRVLSLDLDRCKRERADFLLARAIVRGEGQQMNAANGPNALELAEERQVVALDTKRRRYLDLRDHGEVGRVSLHGRWC